MQKDMENEEFISKTGRRFVDWRGNTGQIEKWEDGH